MAIEELKMPSLGEGVVEADVLKVLVSEGQTVTIEQAVIEVETDKATVEVPSSLAGRITRLLVEPGAQIGSGQPILEIEAEAPAARETTATPTQSPQTQTTTAPTAPSGPGYRPARPPRRPSAPAATPSIPLDGQGPVFASPSVRGLAREIGVNIYQVAGSGPGGRISPEDVKAHARHAAAGPAKPAPAEPLPDFSAFGPVTEQGLSRLRRTIARNLSTSWQSIPHVTLNVQADITKLNRQRRQLKAAGRSVSITAALIEQVVIALKEQPNLNSSFDAVAGQLVLKHYWNIGVAADTERGLIVPVIRAADSKSLSQLGEELADLATRARDGKITPDELTGASFTITNLGTLGIGEFTPIINPPEVAILGVGAAANSPVWRDDRFEPRLTMPLSLSIDHRAIDGADGARFLKALIDGLADPGLA